MIHVVSVRVPSEWRGRVTSEQIRAWVVAWLRQPVPLTENPAPGPHRLSIRFSGTELAALRKIRKKSISSAIRGIAALHISAPISAPKKEGLKWLKGAFEIGLVLLSVFSAAQSAVGQPRGQKS